MGAGTKLTMHIKEFAILTIVIVVMSIVLLKLKTENISNSICSGAFPNYNATSDLCYNSTGATTAISQTGSNINSAVAAIDEPVTWIAIIIIIVVVAFLLKYLKGGKKSSGL